MKYLAYLPWIFIAILSIFFFQEYFAFHQYYANFLTDAWVLTIFIIWVLWALIPVVYLFFGSWKKTWIWVCSSFFIWFVVFALAFLVQDNQTFLWPWFFTFLFNFLIIFTFFSVIILWNTAIWDIILRKLDFKENIYNFAIKTWLWIWVFWIVLFYLAIVGLMNVPIALIIFAILVFLIFLQRKQIKILFLSLLEDFQQFVKDSNNAHKSIKYVFMFIFLICFLYIYFWFVNSFIPYPSAWDANHAYMFVPKIIAQYGWYPWHTDFRPVFGVRTSFLIWIYNVWFFTNFAQDTWMTSFNFLSWIFSLLFWFMLVSTLLKLVHKTKDFKHYILLALWYLLLITFLTSWMWAFLVFVDNKTDLAVFMFITLWLFLSVYSLFQQESEDNNSKNLYLYFALAWFFFGIANFIKPTATFDFFGTFMVFAILNIWIIALIWWVLFVLWFLYYLKYRWFDSLFSRIGQYSSKYGILAMFLGFFIWLAASLKKFYQNKFKVLHLVVFLASFVFTLFISKWFFAINQIIHGDNIIKSPSKIAISLLTSNSLPVQGKDTMTWALYEWIAKEAIWSSYNEDNGRYVWFWNKTFSNPWRSFLMPTQFKDKYKIYFDKQDFEKSDEENKIYVFSQNEKLSKLIDDYSIKILSNKDKNVFFEWIDASLEQIIKTWQLKQVASNYWLDVNLPDSLLKSAVRKKILENSETELLNQTKTNFSSGKLDISSYPEVLRTKSNEQLLTSLKNKTDDFFEVKIPYSYLVPFNVVFNRSLQNHSSYYTDIWIVWLLLFIISLFAFVYSFFIKDKIMGAFAFATLFVWCIWYWVASWIVRYNIWWIMWLILVSVLYANRLKDRWLLTILLILISSIFIILNFSRIAFQSKWYMQFWYKSWVWQTLKYKLESNWSAVPKQDIKIPFLAQDFFNLQFRMYSKAIKAFNERKDNESWIIWWTYMRYFIKNQNKILDDQFLVNLWKIFSDSDVTKSYERLKDQQIKEIVIDPNIASVVMWDWNKSLWYRYYGTTDEKHNIKELWVIPMLVNLAQEGKIEYKYTNNLWIKYALTVSDDVLKELTWKSDPKELLELRYKLSSLKFLWNMLWNETYAEVWNLFTKILWYRIQKAFSWDMDFFSDLADINAVEIDDYSSFLKTAIKTFNSLDISKQNLIIEYQNILNWMNDEKQVNQIIRNIFINSIWAGAQLLYVKVK